MSEVVTPKDFAKGAPPRIMGTEAEDHVSMAVGRGDLDDAHAITWLLSQRNFRKAGIPVVQRPAPENDFLADSWLANGIRMYEDDEMFETSSAESLGARETVAATGAGIHMIRKLADASGLPLTIFRRSATVDYNRCNIRGAAFHMNFLVPENNNLNYNQQLLTTHAATRLFAWAGMVAPEGFTLSQKAHDTRSFFKIKNEGDSGFARLEDCKGEQSSPWGTFMALATTSVLLRVLEHPEQKDLNKRFASLKLANPYNAIRRVSSDLTMNEPLLLADGRELTAIEIQTELADIAYEFSKRFTLPEDEQFAVKEWNIVCPDLQEAADTSNIRPLASRIGWVSKKLRLERKNLDPLDASNPEAIFYDMDWDCIYPKEGGRFQYAKRAALKVPTPTDIIIATDEEVAALVDNPPRGTRAAVRGELITRHLQKPELYFEEVDWHTVSYYSISKRRHTTLELHPYKNTSDIG